MIRPSVVWLTACSLALPVVALPVTAQDPPPAEYTDLPPRYSANQLDNLVGPVALYPDALLAQVLVASTFPDQIEEAARFVRANGTDGIDDQAWDVSVKAVAHYASALNMMADKADWTATLGVAYANQSSEVMTAVQRMRAMAAQHGNLVSTPQQEVVQQGNTYIIAPAQPRVVYVPVYDPIVVYTRPVFNLGFSSRFWSFGVGFPIGGWLSYDCDWGFNRVYYNGWNSAFYGYGGGWRARSRPFVQITNVYVSPRYRNVYVNRNVYRRPINYRNVDRYAGVHRDTYFDGRRDGNRDGNRNGYRDGNRDGYGDGNRDGRGTGRADAGRNDDGYTGRTAQPRGERDAATPEGYRDGNRGARSTVSAPQDRRAEQTSTVRAMGIGQERSPNAERAGERDDSPRDARPRGSQPRVVMPQTGPSITPPASGLPVVGDAQGQDRSSRMMRNLAGTLRRSTGASSPRQSPPASSEPRQAQPRQAQPRVSQPAGNPGGGAQARTQRSSGAKSTAGGSSGSKSTAGGSSGGKGSSRSAGPRGARGRPGA